jgi:ABC-type dipeptide/oligopeptide/nickel transport system permease subunit
MGDGRQDILILVALAWLAALTAAAVLAPVLPLDPDSQDLSNRLASPLSGGHLLGTDGLGRDVLARLVYGARITLTISVSAVAIGALAGGAVGLVAGFYRGVIDGVTMWLANVVLAFPGCCWAWWPSSVAACWPSSSCSASSPCRPTPAWPGRRP